MAGAVAILTKFRVERHAVAAVGVAVLRQSLPTPLWRVLEMALFVGEADSAEHPPRKAVLAVLRSLMARLILPVVAGVERIIRAPLSRMAHLAQMAVVVLVNMVEIPEGADLERSTRAVTATLVALVAVAARTVKAVTAKWLMMTVGALAAEAATVRIIRLPSNVSALVVLALESDVVESAVRLTAGQAGIHRKIPSPLVVAVRRLRVFSGGPVAVAAVHTIKVKA